MPKKNLSTFQDVNSIAWVALQWKQHMRSSMRSAWNFDINSWTYVLLILSYVTNQSSAWYAEAVDQAVIRKLVKIKTLQGLKKSCNKVKGKFAMGNTRNVL